MTARSRIALIQLDEKLQRNPELARELGIAVIFEKGDGHMAARKTRSDCRVDTLEKKMGLPPGTIRNKDGRKTRKDKMVGTIRKEAQKKNERRY